MTLEINFEAHEFFKEHQDILDILLVDRTTKKNIIWATDNYQKKGYGLTDHITSFNVLSKSNPIKPRIEKSKTEQTKRSKDMAEVFTPSWVCNNQNNLIDHEWFGYAAAFNVENDKVWTPTEKVEFRNDKTWKDYVADTRMEITCGEAPYIVSRYDTVTGSKIDLKNRIGLFDRKMRVINENATNDEEWILESKIALKNVYGYEFQGDNLLIARENVFFSYLEYYIDRFNMLPKEDLMKEIAEIISWNLFQMDGLKMVVPFSCHNVKEEFIQISLFDIGEDAKPKEDICPGCKNNDISKHNGDKCMIMDWEKNKKIKFISLMKGGY